MLQIQNFPENKGHDKYCFNNEKGLKKINLALMNINEKRKQAPVNRDINKTFLSQFRTKQEEQYMNDPNLGEQKKNIVHQDKA